MKSNQSHSAARASSPAPGNVQSPSVPISVYRELAAELQTTRAMVDSLNNKNQQLNQENQKLRQEVQRVVHSVLTLQPWLDAEEPLISPPPRKKEQRGTVADRPTWEETAAASAIAAKLRTSSDLQSNEWFTEEATTPQRISQTKPASKLGSVWLTVTILAIIVSAFGAGFLIMRPFLPTK